MILFLSPHWYTISFPIIDAFKWKVMYVTTVLWTLDDSQRRYFSTEWLHLADAQVKCLYQQTRD